MKINKQINIKYLWGALLSPVAGVGCGFGTALFQGFIAVILTKPFGYINGTAAAYGLMFFVLSGALLLYGNKALKTIYPIVGAVGVATALYARSFGSISYLDCGDSCSGVAVQQPVYDKASALLPMVLWSVFVICCVWYIVRLFIAGARQRPA
jgi:hypothetical protein